MSDPAILEEEEEAEAARRRRMVSKGISPRGEPLSVESLSKSASRFQKTKHSVQINGFSLLNFKEAALEDDWPLT